jgi:hypothetical protein
MMQDYASGKPHLSLRWSVVGRYTSFVANTLDILQTQTQVPDDTTRLAAWFRMRSSWHEFMSQSVRPNWAELEGDDFPVQLQDVLKLKDWTDAILLKITDSWAADLNTVVAAVERVLPSPLLITNVKLLTDAGLQKELFGNPHREHIVAQVNTVAAQIGKVNATVAVGVKIAGALKRARDAGLAVKKRGKVALAVDFCICQIKAAVKDGPDGVTAAAVKSTDKITALKVGGDVPDWLAKFLNTCKKPGPVPVAV